MCKEISLQGHLQIIEALEATLTTVAELPGPIKPGYRKFIKEHRTIGYQVGKGKGTTDAAVYLFESHLQPIVIVLNHKQRSEFIGKLTTRSNVNDVTERLFTANQVRGMVQNKEFARVNPNLVIINNASVTAKEFNRAIYDWLCQSENEDRVVLMMG